MAQSDPELAANISKYVMQLIIRVFYFNLNQTLNTHFHVSSQCYKNVQLHLTGFVL